MISRVPFSYLRHPTRLHIHIHVHDYRHDGRDSRFIQVIVQIPRSQWLMEVDLKNKAPSS